LWIAESSAANAAYFYILIFVASRHLRDGIAAAGFILVANKLATSAVATFATCSLAGPRGTVHRSIVLSQTSALALLLFGSSQHVLLAGALVAALALAQFYENNLRSVLAAAGNGDGPSLSPTMLNAATHGSLLFAALLYFLHTWIGSATLQATVPPLLLAVSLALKYCMPRTLPRERPRAGGFDARRLVIGVRSYLSRRSMPVDILLALAYAGSNTLTIYCLTGDYSVPTAILISGVSVWIGMLTCRVRAMRLYGMPCLIVVASLALAHGKIGIGNAMLFWVLAYNVAYWTLFHGITRSLYSQIDASVVLQAMSVRAALLTTIATTGEAIAAVSLQYGYIVEFVWLRLPFAVMLVGAALLTGPNEKLQARTRSGATKHDLGGSV
jgi:hypothetical protein